ncbi:MAG: hypothetical protein ACO3CR_02970 [Solirubrobacterales bacterium]
MPQEIVGDADLKRMARGNVKGVRYSMSWGLVQPTDGDSFEWGYYDSVFRAAARNGIRILPSLYYTPEWLSSEPTDLPVENSEELSAWKNFVRAAVARYGKRGTFWKENGPSSADPVPKVPVRQWMIWNEPNFFYFASPVSPTEYGRLLNASSTTIEKADPAARVMVGGLFARPTGTPKEALSAAKFVTQMMRTARKKSFDDVALHPYTPSVSQLKLVLKEFDGALKKAGLGSKKVVVSEIGWGSGPKDSPFATGSKKAQARILNEAFTLLIKQRARYRIQSVYWYSWKDLPPDAKSCNFCSTIGLFEAGDRLVAKPAWRAFVKFTRGRP